MSTSTVFLTSLISNVLIQPSGERTWLLVLCDHLSHGDQVGLQRVRGHLVFQFVDGLDDLLCPLQGGGQEHRHRNLDETGHIAQFAHLIVVLAHFKQSGILTEFLPFSIDNPYVFMN